MCNKKSNRCILHIYTEWGIVQRETHACRREETVLVSTLMLYRCMLPTFLASPFHFCLLFFCNLLLTRIRYFSWARYFLFLFLMYYNLAFQEGQYSLMPRFNILPRFSIYPIFTPKNEQVHKSPLTFWPYIYVSMFHSV